MHYAKTIDIYRLILAFFVCVITDGYVFSTYQPIAGFATIAFFILTGYMICRETANFEERMKRAIKRTAILFGIFLAACLLADVIFCIAMDIIYRGQLEVSTFWNFKAFLRLRTWFELLVLNVWPMSVTTVVSYMTYGIIRLDVLPFGQCLWFLQSLLYAYIILFVLHKLKLTQKKWFDPVVCIVLLLFALVSGELSSLLNFHVFNYEYIPGNFLTRALPYILVGRLIFRWQRKLKRYPKYVYIIAAAAGVGLSVLEIMLLSRFGKLTYAGHLFGNGVLAAALTVLVVTMPVRPAQKKPFNGGLVAKVVYLSHEAVSFCVMTLTVLVAPTMSESVLGAMPFVTYLLCCLGVLVYALVVNFKNRDKSHGSHHGSHHSSRHGRNPLQALKDFVK